MTSYMARLGARLIANGYHIIPIAPGTKRPGQYRKGKWGGYSGWNQHVTRPTTEIEVDTWSTWPDAGIGIVGGTVAAVDIDLLDGASAGAVESLARRRLGDTPAMRIGRAPKRLLVYRTVEPFKGVKKPPIEVLCLGQQFVAFADHPDTGRPYEWPEESLADIDIASLPAIDEARAREFLEEAIALVPIGLRAATLALEQPAAATAHVPAHSLKGTPEAIASALAAIPNPDLDYDSWIRIGMSIKGALGDAGAPFFALWSAKSAKNVPEFTATTWAGLRPERIGAGSIYYEAGKHGWVPDPSLVLDGSMPADPVEAAGPFLDKIAADAARLAGDLPSELARPSRPSPAIPDFRRLDGVLKLFVDYILATAIRPQPWLAVGASLTALGVLMGRKVRTETDLRSNLYVIGIAESGGGKDHARRAIKQAFLEAGLTKHLGGEQIASGAGMLAALVREPSTLFQIDEAGKFIADVIDKRRAPKHLSEIWDLLTKLATNANGPLYGAEYADQKERPRQDIMDPCACLHGVTAPQPLWDAFRSMSLHDGSLARFLFFRAEEDIPDRNRYPGSLSLVPRELIAGLQRIAAGVRAPKGNLQAVDMPSIKPDPIIVQMDAEAQALFDALDLENTAVQREAAGSTRSAVLARVWENTAKVALIKAVSAAPDGPVIRGEDAAWARDVVACCVDALLGGAERHLADNETERNHKRVLEIIRSAGAGGITRNELTRRTQFLDNRQRNEILVSLADADQIASAVLVTGKRQALVYTAKELHS